MHLLVIFQPLDPSVSGNPNVSASGLIGSGHDVVLTQSHRKQQGKTVIGGGKQSGTTGLVSSLHMAGTDAQP